MKLKIAINNFDVKEIKDILYKIEQYIDEIQISGDDKNVHR